MLFFSSIFLLAFFITFPHWWKPWECHLVQPVHGASQIKGSHWRMPVFHYRHLCAAFGLMPFPVPPDFSLGNSRAPQSWIIQTSCPNTTDIWTTISIEGDNNWHQVMNNYICRELTFPSCLLTDLDNYRGSCQMSINITGKASLCMNQTTQTMCSTLNRLHRIVFPRTILSSAYNALSWSNCLESSSVDTALQFVGSKWIRTILPPF